MQVDVYSDGSGNTFDSDGGWGFQIVLDGKLYNEGSGYLPSATNNVAEITAAIRGLEACKQLRSNIVLAENDEFKVTLISDSQLVLGYASGRYKCKALHLTQLYIQLRQLYKELNAETKWVRGHAGDTHNEECDRLAKAARESKGVIASSNV